MSVKLRCQRGFTTVTLMGVLLVGGLLVMASFAAVDPDIGLSRTDQHSKQAYAAAESGLQWYLSALSNDNSYYTKCDDGPPPNATEQTPVNQEHSSGQPFKWRNLPAEQAKYGIELLPAREEGATECTSDQYSMIDRFGNMRLRISGRSGDKTRSIIATLRRRNFIDFIYFTHFETLDPAAYDDVEQATEDCAWFRADRDNDCEEIQFATDDEVLGPFHTNDNILVCGSPQFGRDGRSTDAIEINGPQPVVRASGCSANPDYEGTLVHPAGELQMPSSNNQLEDLAVAEGLWFEGRTDIDLNGATMRVKNWAAYGDNLWHTVNMPSNGVVYVQNQSATCLGGYNRDNPYSADSGCGDVWVKGTYGDDLTIAAANDIIINDDVRSSNDELLLGLIANNFVRVYHPISGCGTDGSGSQRDLVIEAAILALQHSFLVDNWRCGDGLGDLNVFGAIAQQYRGPVGTTAGTGYIKNYEYNDRLRYREPPYFLDPVLAAWRISRQSEQLPSKSDLPD
jgi:hypothetical protein